MKSRSLTTRRFHFQHGAQYFNLQEANGLRVAVLQSYDNRSTGGRITATPGWTAPFPGPDSERSAIVDPRVMVTSIHVPANPRNLSYRNLRLQSSSIKNITMNGNVRYTKANTNLANYYDDFQVCGTTREATYAATPAPSGKRSLATTASLGRR